MKFKHVLFFLYFSLSLALVLTAFIRSPYFKSEKTEAGGFGISPPFVIHDSLKPGDSFEKKITLLRSTAEKISEVDVSLLAPDIESWIKIIPGELVKFNTDKLRTSVKVLITVPINAAPGNYKGKIYFIISPDGKKNKITIASGARADINLTVLGSIEQKEVESEKDIRNILFKAEDENLYEYLKGRIVIKTEDKGRAFYIHPNNKSIYSLGRPEDAYKIIKEQGVGITNNDLNKIPVGTPGSSEHNYSDDDLFNILKDIINAKIHEDKDFAIKHSGVIFLQIEERGRAWYVNPGDLKRYFLGRPEDAFFIMQKLGYGISNSDFNKLVN